MTNDTIQRLYKAVRDVPDFPKPGILFKDITPILADPVLFRECVGLFIDACKEQQIEKIVGVDARGFLFGAAVAYELSLGFIPVRKKGKLPHKTESAAYSLEYGEAVMEIHIDAINRGERVALIDDLLATGGTAAAACALISRIGATLVEAQFLIELESLNGRKNLEGVRVRSFLKY